MIKGSAFKELIASVTKFPMVGSFAGSEQINLWTDKKYLHASTTGIVLSHGKMRRSEDASLPVAIAIDERALINYTNIIHPAATLNITVEEKQVVLQSRNKVLHVPLTDGKKLQVSDVPDVEPIKITNVLAKRLSYLSEVAFNDGSKAELCCVMLCKDSASAINQKVIASMKGTKVTGKVPIPLHLAKVMSVDDTLYAGEELVVLKSGCAMYSMPSLTIAQKQYPLSLVSDLNKKERKDVVILDGGKLAEAVSECQSVMASIAKTIVILKIQIQDGKIKLYAKNAGFEFQRTLPVIKCCVAKALYRVELPYFIHIIPFLSGKAVLAESTHGELFVMMGFGWVAYPAYIVDEKSKKKAKRS